MRDGVATLVATMTGTLMALLQRDATVPQVQNGTPAPRGD